MSLFSNFAEHKTVSNVTEKVLINTKHAVVD